MINIVTQPGATRLAAILGFIVVALAACDAEPGPGNERTAEADLEAVHIRINLLGYLEEDSKIGLAFSHVPATGTFDLVNAETGNVVFTGEVEASAVDGWGKFDYYYDLDFSVARSRIRSIPGRSTRPSTSWPSSCA